MVAAEKRDGLRVAHLETEQQLQCLHTVVAAIDEVAHEDVPGLGNVTAHAEELQKIVELAVDIAADSDGTVHRLHVGLLDEDLLGLVAKVLQLNLR